MSRKKWNKVVAGVLVTALAFANSITVFAYRDVHQEIMPDDASQEDIEYSLNTDDFLFFSEGTEEEVIQDFDVLEEIEIQYDNQFIDEEGNIYLITEPVQRGCSHTYDSGTEVLHQKKSNGGCEVREYHAQRCTKCGLVVRGALIKTIIFEACPH